MAIAIGSWYAPSGLTTNQATYVSGVFQPSAGTLILAFVEIDAAAYSKPTAINSGHNLVWTEVTSRGGANYGVSIWRAMSAGTSPASGGASICFSGNRTGCSWGFLAVTGVPSSSDGSSAIVQYASSSSSGNSATTTLSALANPNNAVIAAVGIGANENVTAEAGYTAMSTQPGHNNPSARLGVMYQLASADVNPSQSWTSSVGYAQIAIELAVDAIATYIRTNRTYGTQDFTYRNRIGEYIRYNSNLAWGMAAVGQSLVSPVATFFRTLAHTVWSGVQPARLRELIRNSSDVLSNTFSAKRIAEYIRRSVGTELINFSSKRLGEYIRKPTHVLREEFSAVRYRLMSRFLTSSLPWAQGGAATYSDNFDRSNGDLGADWLTLKGAPAIQNNRVMGSNSYSSDPENTAIYTAQGQLGDKQWAQVTFATAYRYLWSNAGLVLNARGSLAGTGTFFYAFSCYHATQTWLGCGGPAGTYNEITIDARVDTGQVARFETEGDGIYVFYVDGSRWGSYVYPGEFATVGGYAGLEVNQYNMTDLNEGYKLDNFSCGPLGVAAGTNFSVAASLIVGAVATFFRTMSYGVIDGPQYWASRSGWYLRNTIENEAIQYSLSRANSFARNIAHWIAGVSAASRSGEYIRAASRVPVKTWAYDRFSTYAPGAWLETVGNWDCYPLYQVKIATLSGTWYADWIMEATVAQNIHCIYDHGMEATTADYRVSIRGRQQTIDYGYEYFRFFVRDNTPTAADPITAYVCAVELHNGATFRLSKHIDGATTVLGTGIWSKAVATSYHIYDFQVSGSNLAAFYDKHLIVSATDSDITEAGKAGWGLAHAASNSRISHFSIGEPYHGIVETPQRIGEYLRNVAASLGILHLIGGVKALLRTLTTSLENTSVILRIKEFVRTIGQVLSQTIGLAQSLIGITRRTIGILVSSVSAVGRYGYFARTLQTLRSLALELSRRRTYFINLITTVQTNFSLKRIGQFARQITEGISRAISVKRIGEYIRTRTVSRQIADIVNRAAVFTRAISLIRSASSAVTRRIVAYIRSISLTINKAIGLVQSILGITRRTASTIMTGAMSVARVGAYVRRVTRGVVTGFSLARLRELIRRVTIVLKNVSSLRRFTPEFIRSIRQSTAFGLVLTYYARLISTIWGISTTVYRMMMHTTNVDQKDKYSTDTDRKDNYSA